MALGSIFAVSGQTSMTGQLPGMAALRFSAGNPDTASAWNEFSEA
jgi:hypothetical protein